MLKIDAAFQLLFGTVRCKARQGVGIASLLLAALLAILVAPCLAAGTVAYPLSFAVGWNLAGNSLATPVNLKTAFGTQTNVQTVWTWDAGGARWLLYSPALDAAGSLATYASSHGYGVLTTIGPGQGFWVNALVPVSLAQQSGTGFSLGASGLVAGWNLVATADDVTAAVLTSNIGNVTSLWAWENATATWYFYSPVLAANNSLASYLQSNGYKDFGTSTLGQGRGFWINRAPSAPAPLTLILPARAIGASQLAVIVADGDALSASVADYYQQARGIPAANVIHVQLPSTSDTISAADFAAVKAAIDSQLTGDVEATLLTWTAPSRVVGSCVMSITSAMAFGYDAKYCAAGCVSTAASPYYDSESAQPWLDYKIRPSMMLGARTLDAAKALIDRGVQADATQPPGDGYLLRTSDEARSVRYSDYVNPTNLPDLWAGNGGLQLSYIDNSAGGASDSITGKSGVLFYFTGLASVPNLATNSFRPGAIGDHLTSFGGYLPNGNGQMPITAWLDAGATASYGTVAEPCNYEEKFSRASVLIDQYYRGATLIEAYWKSVAWPGQGLFVGEPLAQPFADQPDFTVSGGRYLISTRAMRAGSRYSLQYRTAASNWIALATFTVPRAQAQTVTAPLAPASATQLRWQGPCPTDLGQQCSLSTSP